MQPSNEDEEVKAFRAALAAFYPDGDIDRATFGLVNKSYTITIPIKEDEHE